MLELLNQQDLLGKNFQVYGTWENPLFLAKDVAEWIEHSDVSMMLKKIDEDEKLTQTMLVSGQNREMWFLTEDGLYEVLMQSRKPIAKGFKKEVKRLLKEVRTKGSYQTSNLSPQLQLLIDMELRQKEFDKALETTNQRIDSIREVVALDTRSWRADSQAILRSISKELGGIENIRDVNNEIYTLLEQRASVKLATRLNNKRRKMAEEGVCKSKRDKMNKLDIIAEDKPLIEIYVAIVKEMAIKFGIDLPKEQQNSMAMVE